MQTQEPSPPPSSAWSAGPPEPKRLIISDLDGTLLNRQKIVTERTSASINAFIARGGLFAVATARMAYGCDTKLADIRMTLPGIVMNGASLYRFDTKVYSDTVVIESSKALEVVDAVVRHGAGGFLYSIGSDGIRLGYLRDNDLSFTQYNSQRAQEAAVEIQRVAAVERWIADNPVCYIAVTGDQAIVKNLEASLVGNDELRVNGYDNIYSATRCLEIADRLAGKEQAARRMVGELGVEELIVFGDGHNDLALMSAADVSYAPVHAPADVKVEASEVIGSNDEDAVAEILDQRY